MIILGLLIWCLLFGAVCFAAGFAFAIHGYRNGWYE